MADRDSRKGSMAEHLLIVGASSRAAAFSALRAGLTVSAADLFADADLARVCRVAVVDPFPNGFRGVLRTTAEADAWLYTGGLENQPSLIDSMAAQRPLHGNRGAALLEIRSPTWLAPILRQGGFHVPRWQPSPAGLPQDGSWLRKRRSGSGGFHVRRFFGDLADQPRESDWYFQQFVPGMPASAVYVALADGCRLLGATESWLAPQDGATPPFAYAGSIGPLPLSDKLKRQLVRLGETLASAAGLIGLFGVDFVIRQGEPWPIEVNPRYPASAEVLESALGISAIALHVAACRGRQLPETPRLPKPGWCAKRIVYATQTVRIKPWHTSEMLAHCGPLESPRWADIPQPGTTIQPGSPVATVFARGDWRVAVEEEIEHQARRLGKLLSE